MIGRERLAPTAAALCVLLVVAFYAAFRLTLGFHAFTSEEVRRLRVARAPRPISSVAIVDSQAAPRTLWNGDRETRVWLVTFMYTRCPSICAALGDEFQQLQAAIGAGEGVRLASLSFDRAHDLPGALADYARRYGVDASRWLVAVPSNDDALSRLLRETGVIAITDGQGGYVHNAAIHVVTSSGELVALFDLERHREALAYARRLAR